MNFTFSNKPKASFDYKFFYQTQDKTEKI